MTPSLTNGLLMRLALLALGIGLSMAAVSAFAAPPPSGSTDAQPVPQSAAPGGNPSRDSNVAHRRSADQARMSQERTDEAYILIIDLNGLAPENVQVRPFGQSLLVRTRHDARTHRSETFGDGRGYRERYQISTGSSSRRLPVPPDGDLAGLTREDSAEQVRILIPRRAAAGWR